MGRSRFTVRLLSVAEEDLAEIVSYIAADNPAAGLALMEKMEKSLSALGRHPYIGRVPDDTELMRLGYRFLVVDDYLIFYSVRDRDVLVHRILHGARDYQGLM